MTFIRFLVLMVVLLPLSTVANAQTIQVNQQNRTIEVSGESAIEITADRVTITVGYRNFDPTHDDAFADNARASFGAHFRVMERCGCRRENDLDRGADLSGNIRRLFERVVGSGS